MLERFRATSPVQQILAVLLAVAIIGCLLAAVWFFLLRTTYQPLFTDLRATDAATIIAELDRRKIPYRLDNGGTTILVPADQADATRLSVTNEELPLKGMVGFELFNKSDMGLTDFAQKINFQRALQGELARTIMTLDGVDTARVHLSRGEDRVFRDDRVPSKASVAVRMENGATVPHGTVEGIARMVAAAVPQLDIADVVILDETGQVVSASPMSGAQEAGVSPLLQEKRAIEQYYEARVRGALDNSYPAGSIAVTVWANVAVKPNTASGARSALPAWNPADRGFRLQVTLAPSLALTPDALQDVRNLAGNAIGYDPALGDVLAFGAAQERPSFPAGAGLVDVPDASLRPAAPRTTTSEEQAPGHATQAVLVALLALAVLAGLFLTMRRERRPQTLNESERAAFAVRLRALLREEDGDATPQG